MRKLFSALFLVASINAQADGPYGIAGGASAEELAAEIPELRAAAEQGDPDAQFRLGQRYQFGLGTIVDKREAAIWYSKVVETYRKQAEQGNAVAQYKLAELYELGRGVERDRNEAISLYRKAAEQGYVIAQKVLGLRYFQGQGVPSSDAQAAFWTRKAADQGDAEAKESLTSLCNEEKYPDCP